MRVAMDSLWVDATSKDRRIASQHSNIIVIAILITSTLGSALTTALGPLLLSQDSRVAPEGLYLFYGTFIVSYKSVVFQLTKCSLEIHGVGDTVTKCYRCPTYRSFCCNITHKLYKIFRDAIRFADDEQIFLLATVYL